MTQPVHLWSRLETESARAYAAFLVYRDMGVERSLEKVQQKTAKNTSYVRQLSKWSSAYEWVRRAEAWDAHLIAEREALEEESRRTTFETERRKAQQSRRQVVQALDGLLRKLITEKASKYDERQLKDLTTAARVIFQESRLEFGEATSITDNRVSGIIGTKSVDELTDEELVAILQRTR